MERLEVLPELPRLRWRLADLCGLYAAYAAAQVRSEFLVDLLMPMVLEQAPAFRAAQWLTLLSGA